MDTQLSYIEWSCAVSTISPVAVFEPVQIEGTTVSRASLCNLSEIERLGLGKHCTLSVIKANKIIPKCVAVKDAEGEVEIPRECPVCHAPTEVRVSSNSGTKSVGNGYRWLVHTDNGAVYQCGIYPGVCGYLSFA